MKRTDLLNLARIGDYKRWHILTKPLRPFDQTAFAVCGDGGYIHEPKALEFGKRGLPSNRRHICTLCYDRVQAKYEHEREYEPGKITQEEKLKMEREDQEQAEQRGKA